MSVWPEWIFKEVRLCLYGFPLPREIPLYEPTLEVEYEVVGQGSRGIAWLSSIQEGRLIERRLGRGERCFLALHQGRVVSYCWFSQARVGIEEVDLTVVVQPDEAYLYDAFTLPQWRGRGLYPALLTRMVREAMEVGCRRAMIFVVEDNLPSRQGIEKAGFELFQRISHYKLLGFSWYRSGPRLTSYREVRLVRSRF